MEEKIVVENVNISGTTTRVDRAKYEAMYKAMREVLPIKAPGFTQNEMWEAVISHLPESLFPGGSKAGWWVKTVQLDQEAKGNLTREPSKPLRWHWVY